MLEASARDIARWPPDGDGEDDDDDDDDDDAPDFEPFELPACWLRFGHTGGLSSSLAPGENLKSAE